MNHLYIFLLIISGPITLVAQDPCAGLNYHAFKAENIVGVYTDLGTLGNEIEVSQWDDANSDPQEIGFTFEYQCQDFTQFILNTNGLIKLGSEPLSGTHLFFKNAQTTAGGVFESDTIADINLIVAFNHDLDRGTGTPEFRVHTSGGAPHRVCTIQWKNMREWTSDPPKQYDNIEFQIKLYETTNVIEFVYGEWAPSENTAHFKTGAAGLKGAGPEDDQLLVVIKPAGSTWDIARFENGNYAPNESFDFGRPPLAPKPDPGRTFRFSPTLENDLTVREIYNLGYASTWYSSPQKISANIRNSGFNTQSNIPVILEITGANTYVDTQYISSLSFGADTNIAFSGFSPTEFLGSYISVSVGDDDNNADNIDTALQFTNEFSVAYADLTFVRSAILGFPSGVQGIYYVKYPIHGTASIKTVSVIVTIDEAAVGQTVFAIILNSDGEIIAQSDDQEIGIKDQGENVLTFGFSTPVEFSNTEFYVGFGMRVSPVAYSLLGLQKEEPIQPGTYYTSLINGSGLTEMDPITFSHRFMIFVELEGTDPVSGTAYGDTTICVGDVAELTLEGSSGFIQWQESEDDYIWSDVNAPDAQSPNFTTIPLSISMFYRAEVSQPGFNPVYSNSVYVDVVPHQPYITTSVDTLISSFAEGNQWYNQDGPIPGATGQTYVVTVSGTYYVVVTIGGCTSLESNHISAVISGTEENDLSSMIKVYPNPVGDILYIEIDDEYLDRLVSASRTMDFEILDLMGKIVYKGELSESKLIKTDWMLPGLYFIRFKKSGFVRVKYLMKD